MALTATATPSVRQEVIEHLDNPVTSIDTMNQPNIFYEVHLLKSCKCCVDDNCFITFSLS